MFRDELAEAVIEGKRKQYIKSITTAPLLILDDCGIPQTSRTAAEDRRKSSCAATNKSSTLLTSNRPVEDWGKQSADGLFEVVALDAIRGDAG